MGTLTQRLLKPPPGSHTHTHRDNANKLENTYRNSNVVHVRGNDDVASKLLARQVDVVAVLNLAILPFYDPDNDFSFLASML